MQYNEQVKVKSSTCFIKYSKKEVYREGEEQLHAFLASAQDGGKWSVSSLSLYPAESTSSTHSMRNSLNTCPDISKDPLTIYNALDMY